MTRRDQVLLVTMPWATPIHPSLGLGLLGAILGRAEIATACLHGNLLLPGPRSTSVFTITDPGYYEDRSAGLAFVPHLYPHVTAQRIADTVAQRHWDIVTREGQLEIDAAAWQRAGDDSPRAQLVAQTLEDIERAGVCLERCMAEIARGRHDVIGFSITFETQLVASLALSRLIKERWPDVRIMFGGAACFSIQGRSILESFAFVDAVCTAEGDEAIVPLVRGLRGEGDLDAAPGVLYRRAGLVREAAPARTLRDLDGLPTPDYAAYFAQKAQSDWRDTITVLLFETSRGCWWGAKHLCRFCGLNGETLEFRSKSPDRVLDEIDELCTRWDTRDGLQAVDNIFDMTYFRTLLPRLARRQRERPVGIFFEIKSNLRLDQLFQLADAAVLTLQPGIEAFNDHVLELMDKGATMLHQINFIKWSTQVGIATTYNLLLRNPGERAEDYREMIDLIPTIDHLPPPNGIANMQLERYSPYFMTPDRFGLRNVRPKAHYQDMFPDAGVRIPDLVYQFDFDHDELDAPELVKARRDFIRAVLRWKRAYEPGRLLYRCVGDDVLVVDRRAPGEPREERLCGPAAAVFLHLDEPRPFKALAQQFPAVAPDALRALLARLVAQRVVHHHVTRDRYLSVAIRSYADRREYEHHRDRCMARSSARLAVHRPAPRVPAP